MVIKFFYILKVPVIYEEITNFHIVYYEYYAAYRQTQMKLDLSL